MKSPRALIIWIFSVSQIALLVVEVSTRYDTAIRQNTLALTDALITLSIILFDRWLGKRGQHWSWLTFLLVALGMWVNALGNFQHLYGTFWWWDRVTHTIGGMAVTAAFIDLFLALKHTGRLEASWSVTAWLGMMAGQLLGSIYEISEWLGDLWFHTERVRGPYDTPHDLFQNLIGGLLVLGVLYMLERRRKRV